MELRYVTTGSAITAIAAVFIVFGIVTNDSTVLGVSISSLVLGLVILTLGLTYVEPASELMRYYSEDLNTLVSRFLEDLGIAGNHTLRTCLSDSNFLIVYSQKPLGCGEVRAGLGVLRSNPYLGVPMNGVMNHLSTPPNPGVIEDVDDYLRDSLIKSYSICRGLRVRAGGEGNTLTLELRLNESSKQLLKSPVNLVRLVTLASLTKYFGMGVEVVNEVLTGDTYIVNVRLGGSVEA